MSTNAKKPAKWGCDYVRGGTGWTPVKKTASAWRKYAERNRRAELARGMVVRVADCGDYYRINVAGQPF